jgi:hypothetical protein
MKGSSSSSSRANPLPALPEGNVVCRLDQVRRRLAGAKTLAEVKSVHGAAHALVAQIMAEDGGKARFPLLDAAVELRCQCTRAGGQMLLTDAQHVPGVDVESWRRRGAMDAATFARAVRKAQIAARQRAGELPAAIKRPQPDAPQARTLISPWHTDRSGVLARYVVGVSPARYRSELAAGRNREAVEAALIREAVERAV